MASDTPAMQHGHAREDRAAAMARADAEAGAQGRLVLGILAGTFLFIAALVTISSRPATITLTPSRFAVRGGGYSAEFARADIDSVRLVTGLSGLGRKENGFQWGSVYAGRFAMRPFGSARLFVDTSRPPYVAVYARTGVVIVNDRDAAATERLYAELQHQPAAPAAGQK